MINHPNRNKKAKQTDATVLETVKGFDPSLKCRGFQFEMGKTYSVSGKVKACENGFHACENPFDVWGYYPLTNDDGVMNRFCLVEQAGEIDRSNDDSKIASASITIKAELTLPEFIKRGVDWIISQVDFTNAPATNTGYQSAATNTGYQSAATNTGDQSAATNTGNRSAATNTGIQSAATNTGNRSAATNTGKFGSAFATGIGGKVSGAVGCALHLDERRENWGEDNHGEILHVWAGIVGRDGIKPGTFYTLRDGKPVEVNAL